MGGTIWKGEWQYSRSKGQGLGWDRRGTVGHSDVQCDDLVSAGSLRCRCLRSKRSMCSLMDAEMGNFFPLRPAYRGPGQVADDPSLDGCGGFKT